VLNRLKTREQATKQSKPTNMTTFLRPPKIRFVVSALEEGPMVSVEIGGRFGLVWFGLLVE
jgi:hypothetical protein